MNFKSAIVAFLAVAFSAVASLPVRAESLNKEGEWTKTISLKRGATHTFWVDGLTPDTSVFSIDVEGMFTYRDEDGDKQEDYVYATEYTDTTDESGNTTGIYVLLTADDWSMADNVPNSVTFTVTVSGFYDEDNKKNNSFSFHHSDGDADFPGEIEPPEPAIPTGADEDHAASLAFKETAKPEDASSCGTFGATLLSDYGNAYYVRTSAKLTGGRKYLIGLVGGSGINFEIRTKGSSYDISDTLKTYTNVWEDCSKAYELVPETSDDIYVVVLSGSSPEAFTLRHAVLPTRTPEGHNPVDLAVGATSEEFKPGYLNDPESGAYDPVIDQCLFRVSGYVKGDNVVFRTEGADSDLVMRLYDKSGKVLAENLRMGDDNREVSLAWTATANASASSAVYLGVCQNLEDGEVPSAGNVTVTASIVDLSERTTPLTPVPDGSYRSPEMATGVISSEERSLGASEWFNTFVVAARKGVTYRVKAVGGSGNGLKLDALLYTLSGAAKRQLPANAVSGSIDPGSVTWLEFTPTANGMVYIDVFVADDDAGYGAGKGLEYDSYRLYSSADGSNLGILTVPMKGAPQDKMGWKILKKDGSSVNGEVFYAANTSVVLPSGSSYTLVANKVDGFAAPDSKGYATVSVEAGTVPKTVDEYKYTDTADPLDNSPDTGAVEPSTRKKYSPAKLAPAANKAVVANRTLWREDPGDWFAVAATAGCYYKFSFVEKTGAMKMAVYGPDNWTTECEYAIFKDPEDELQICAAKKGSYYVKVSHLDEGIPVDSSYTLKATTANPGVVKFAKTAVSVKDSAAYVDLSVSRTSKDGVVRVKYRTDGAQTDRDDAYYYPTNGVLRWEAGDNKAKTIRVRLVPAAGWTTNRTFGVVLTKFLDGDATFDPENEYPATFDIDKQGKTIDTAVVTVTASAKKSPGTIRAVCVDPKKPVFTVTAGETAEIPFERALGADGVVGVKVETVKGTANKSGETDFTPVTTNLVWDDGETDVKTVCVDTTAVAGDYTAVKTFTLKLTALTSAKTAPVQYEKPAFAASSATVNITNDMVADTLANYAKTVTAAANGYTVKEGKPGQWVVDADGRFLAPNGGDIEFTFSTTGVFTYKENGGTKKTFTATAKDKTLKVKGATEFEIVDYALDGEIVSLRQGVKYEGSFGSEGTVKVSNLPAGLKLSQDKATKEWSVSGVPSKAGIFQAVCSTTVGRTTTDRMLCYNVSAQGTSAGTFSGLATTFDTMNEAPALASVAITAALGGKLSAKVVIAGKSYSFSDTGYAYVTGDPDDPDAPLFFTAEFSLLQKVGSGNATHTVTNWLYYTVMDVPETDPSGWFGAGEVEIQMSALPDAKGSGYQEDIWYSGKVYRDNSKMADKGALAAWQSEAARFAGYYTVSLVAPDAMPGEPRGSGYMTMTLDSKGKAKLSGKLADGTSYSASAVAALVGETEFPSVRVPLYAFKGVNVFGGWLSIRENDNGDLVAEIDSPDTDIVWKSDDPAATREGEYGFSLYLQPVGGWYDTVSNLQRSYLESDLYVDLPEGDEALDEIMDALALGGSYAFVAQPSGQAVDLAGNSLSVAKQALVKDAAKKLIDWNASVNASNVKLTFKRATGVVSGTFDLWYEGKNTRGVLEQKSLTGLKHEGVLLLSRGDDGYLEDDVLSSGFFLAPQTLGKRKWTGSYRFDIRAVAAERIWTDAEDE